MTLVHSAFVLWASYPFSLSLYFNFTTVIREFHHHFIQCTLVIWITRDQLSERRLHIILQSQSRNLIDSVYVKIWAIMILYFSCRKNMIENKQIVGLGLPERLEERRGPTSFPWWCDIVWDGLIRDVWRLGSTSFRMGSYEFNWVWKNPKKGLRVEWDDSYRDKSCFSRSSVSICPGPLSRQEVGLELIFLTKV